MKKRLNVVFFGLCFMASLIAEAYCIQVLKGEIISTIGISTVVLITGYLLLDTIRSNLKLNMDRVKFYTDHVLKEETARWNERYTELVNLQKATYTATKKNTAAIVDEMREIISRLEVLEINHLDEFHKINDLQRKSMEGQKNALNMDIHYNRENTKKIVESIQGAGNITELKEQFEQIIKLLEANHSLLEKGIQPVIIPSTYNTLGENTWEDGNQEELIEEQRMDNSLEEAFEMEGINVEDINTVSQEEAFEIKGINVEDINTVSQEETFEIKGIEAEDMNTGSLEEAYEMKVEEEELNDSSVEDAIAELLNYQSDLEKGPVIASFDNSNELVSSENIQEEISAAAEINTDPSMMNEEPAYEEPPKEETSENITITPLYADPNKSLSADEIAALFASFGK